MFYSYEQEKIKTSKNLGVRNVALEFLRSLRNVGLVKKSEYASDADYKNALKGKLFDLEKNLLNLQDSLNKEFDAELILVKQRIGDESYNSELATYTKTDGTESYIGGYTSKEDMYKT